MVRHGTGGPLLVFLLTRQVLRDLSVTIKRELRDHEPDVAERDRGEDAGLLAEQRQEREQRPDPSAPARFQRGFRGLCRGRSPRPVRCDHQIVRPHRELQRSPHIGCVEDQQRGHDAGRDHGADHDPAPRRDVIIERARRGQMIDSRLARFGRRERFGAERQIAHAGIVPAVELRRAALSLRVPVARSLSGTDGW